MTDQPPTQGTPRPTPRSGVVWVVVAVALSTVALALRWETLAPPSLWLDDAWLAVGHRGNGLVESLRAVIAAPGHGLLLFGWLDLVGFSELRAQLPGLLAALAAVPATIWMARRAGASLPVAALGGALLMAHTTHRTFSGRVKPYTLEVLLALLLIGLTARHLDPDREVDERVVLRVAIVGFLATTVSTMLAVTAGACVVSLVVAAGARGGNLTRHLRVGLAWLVATGLWALLVIRPNITSGVRGNHEDNFLSLTGGGETARRLGDAMAALGSWFDGVPWWLILLVVAAGWVVAARRAAAWLVLVTLPLAGSLFLAFAGQAPIGVARLDLHLLPSLLLAIILAASAATSRLAGPGSAAEVGLGSRRSWAAVAVVGIALSAAPFLVTPDRGPLTTAEANRFGYPVEDVSSRVALLEEQRTEGDAIVVYSAARWAYGLYTPADVSLVVDEAEGTGFHLDIDDSAVTMLRTWGGGGEADLDAVLARRPARIWLVASHWRQEHLAAIADRLAIAGYDASRPDVARGALLQTWTRTTP